MQRDNFRNLNRMFLLYVSQVYIFWYCFKVIKWYTFHYLMKLLPIPYYDFNLK